MEKINVDQIKAELAIKQREREIKDSLPKLEGVGIKNSNAIMTGGFTKGFGQVYEKDMSGNYQMKYKNYLGADGNENRLAEQQGTFEKIRNGVAKNTAKVGLYATDAVVGTLYGIGTAISRGSWDGLWDNDVSNTLDYASKRLDRSLSNYYTDEEKSKGLLGSTLTANFWANDFLGGLAFVGGAVLPEAIIGALSGGATLATTGAKIGANIAKKRFMNAGKEALRTSIREGALTKGIQTSAKIGSRTGDVVNYARFVAQSTFFEAGMEARHNLHDTMEEWFNKRYAETGEIPKSDEIKRFSQEAMRASNGIFAANVGLLSLTNASMFGKAFGVNLGFMDKLSKPVNKTLFGLGATAEKGVISATKANKLQKVLGKSYFIGRKPFSEGIVEEGLQGVIGKVATAYTDSKYYDDSSFNLMGAIWDSTKEQYGTSEGWKEIGIGMLIGALGGNVSGNWGIEGLAGRGTETYSKTAKSIEDSVEYVNKHKEAFRDLNRTNSIYGAGQAERLDKEEQESLVKTDLFQDTASNIAYIKANRRLKGLVDVELDYNATVDTLNITPEMLQGTGLKSATEYKDLMKSQFKQDLDSYTRAEDFVDRIGLNEVKISKGNKQEVRDAVIATMMLGEKSTDQANKLANNIQQVVGDSGVLSALNFFNRISETNSKLVEKKQEQENNLTNLRDEVVKIQTEIQALTPEQASRKKELSKKYLVVTQQIQELTNSISEIDTILNEDLKNLGETASTYSNINDVLKAVKSLDSYRESLRKAGRNKDAQELDFMVEQYKTTNKIGLETKLALDDMLNSKFFSGKKGKTLISSILGETYKPNADAIKDIKQREADILKEAENRGIRVANVEELLEKYVAENDDLSEREKGKVESLLRTLSIGTMITNEVDNFNKNIGTLDMEAKNSDTYGNTLSSIEDITVDSENIKGDTIRNVRELTSDKNPTTLSMLKELIDEIASLVDSIHNKPSSEALDLLRSKEKELEAFKEQYEREKEEAVNKEEYQMPEVSNEEGQFEFVFPENTDEEVSEIIEQELEEVEALDENVTELEDLISMIEQDLETIIENESIQDTDTKLTWDLPTTSRTKEEVQDVLNKLKNGEYTTQEAREILYGSPTRQNEESPRTQTEDSTSEDVDNVEQPEDDRPKTTEEKIQELEEEIEELRRPFLFSETSEYKRMTDLMAIPEEDRTEEQQEELDKLEKDVNNWISIMGVELEGLDFSGLVEQMIAMEEIEVTEDVETEEIPQDIVELNFKTSIAGANQNMSVGLNFSAVTAVRKIVDGETVVEIANVTMEGLEKRTGMPLRDQEGVKVNSVTGSIQLSLDKVSEINNAGNVIILNPESGSGTHYSVLLQKNSDGSISTMLSDFEDAGTMDDNIYEVKAGDEVTFKVDPTNSWNENLVKRVKEETGQLTPEEVEQEVEKQLTTNPTKKVENAQETLAKLKAEKANKVKYVEKTDAEINAEVKKEMSTYTTQKIETAKKKIEKLKKEKVSKSKIAKVQEEIDEALKIKEDSIRKSLEEKRTKETEKRKKEDETLNNKIKAKQKEVEDLIEERRNNIRKSLQNKKRDKISKELKEELRASLKIDIVNKDGDDVGVMKRDRNTAVQDADNQAKVQAIRDHFVDNIDKLLEMTDTNMPADSEFTVKVSKVFMGVPSYHYEGDATNLVKVSKPITNTELDKIEDTGYIHNGKIITRTGVENVDNTFVRSHTKNPKNTKVPIIIIKRGAHNIAFPVTVSRDNPPVTRSEMEAVLNNNTISNKDKAIQLNKMLATAGIDISVPGNAFVATSEKESISLEFFNDKVAQVENKDYIRSVEDFIDPSLTKEQILVGNASSTLNFSEPMISPKLKLDLSSIKVDETLNQTEKDVKTKSKSSSANRLSKLLQDKGVVGGIKIC